MERRAYFISHEQSLGVRDKARINDGRGRCRNASPITYIDGRTSESDWICPS